MVVIYEFVITQTDETDGEERGLVVVADLLSINKRLNMFTSILDRQNRMITMMMMINIQFI